MIIDLNQISKWLLKTKEELKENTGKPRKDMDGQNWRGLREQGWRLAQWWERSPSFNVSRVRFQDPASLCELSLLVLDSAPRGFSPGTRHCGFSLSSKNNIWFDIFDLVGLMIWFDLFNSQSTQLVEHSC